MSTRYFFFGTLMDRDVLELVLGRSVADDAFEAAALYGYHRVRVRKDSFPMLVADPGASVDGIVYRTRNAEEDARILFFEDFDYGLLPCRPRTSEGMVDAMFCGIDTAVEPSDEPWDLETWGPRYKAGFLRLSEIYMDCFGRMTPEEAEPIWEKGRLDLVAKGLL
ncbi:MAG: gamma-glutamylcyclotransferase [Alphaproteobacteria bacterium]|nr:gamma-glutamylcyclotransferase [Alphaproteobacteria bacterium]